MPTTSLAPSLTKQCRRIFRSQAVEEWEDLTNRLPHFRSFAIERIWEDGRFEARQDVLAVGDACLNRYRINRAHAISTTTVDGSVTFSLPALSGGGRLRDRRGDHEFSPNTVLVGTPEGRGRSVRVEMAEMSDWVMLVVPWDKIRGVAIRLLGREPPSPLSFTPSIARPLPGLTQSLLAAVHGAEAAERHCLIRKNLEQLIISNALLEIENSWSAHLTTGSGGNEPMSVRRAIAFMEDHLHQPVTVLDVAAHVGIGVRALQLAFRKNRGCSPGQWLRERRLEMAHASLATGMVTVTEAAFACGFGDLSAFAAQFRRHFGYAPSHLTKGDFPVAPPPHPRMY